VGPYAEAGAGNGIESLRTWITPAVAYVTQIAKTIEVRIFHDCLSRELRNDMEWKIAVLV
jgi:hypothetical protein